MRLIDAYRDAIRDCARAGQIEKAQGTQKELDSVLVADPTMKPRVVDLLKYVDPQRDALSGHWYFDSGRLVNAPSNCSRIRFPYRPPPEYDFHMVYDRENADWGIQLALSRLGGTFGCEMPDYQNSRGMGTFAGIMDSVKYDAPEGAMDHCDVCIQVRDHHLKITINGDRCFDREMSSWDFDETPWLLVGPSGGLGVVDRDGKTSISEAEVVEVSGVGEVLSQNE